MTDAFDPYRRLKETMDKKVANARWIATGVVTDVRKKDRKIRVRLFPDLVKTGWLRTYWPVANDKYMMGALPEKDSEVVCLFIGAEPDSAVVLAGGFFQGNDEAPEIGGDHDLLIYDKNGNKIEMKDGGINITADKVEVKAGEVLLGEGAANKLVNETFLDTFMLHTHTAISLGAPTGPVLPTTVILPTHKTSVVKAK